jgi:hypothetical protein
MQSICVEPQSTQRRAYRLARQSIVVEVQDAWAGEAVEKLFAGWYLAPEETIAADFNPDLIFRRSAQTPKIPEAWQQFDIAGGGICTTDGKTSYIDIEGSIIAIGAAGPATVEVWLSETIAFGSDALTRVVTYALAAVLRRRGLFELHSGAVIEPASNKGVLIIGPSGSGKSTLTVQLASAGWPFLTDDVLTLSAKDEEVTAWPLRRCFAITDKTLATSEFLRTRTSFDQLKGQRDEKKQFLPHEVFEKFTEHCIPQTLIFSQLSGEECSKVSALSSGETMTRLIRMNPWSCYDQTTAASHLAVLSALVRQSRGYAVYAGRDLLDVNIAARIIASCAQD